MSYGVNDGWLEVYNDGMCELKEKHTLTKGCYLIVSEPVMHEDRVCVVIRNFERLYVLPIRDLCEIDCACIDASNPETFEMFTVAERSVLLFLQLKQYELAGQDGWFHISYDEIIKNVGGIEKHELKPLIDKFVSAKYFLDVDKTPVFNDYGKVLPYRYRVKVTYVPLPYSSGVKKFEY